MKQFEFKRFALVLWRELATAWKTLAVYAALSILLLIYSEINAHINITLRENTFYTITVAGAIVMASRVLSNIWKRRSCIATFSLPAASVETFAARYLLWLVLPLWFAINMLVFREWLELSSWNSESDIYYPFKLTDFWYGWGPTIQFIIIAAHLAMLGGAFFNRLVLVKTAAVAAGAVVVFSMCYSIYLKHILDTTGDVSAPAITLKSILWLLVVVSMIAGVALSYRRFSRRTVDGYRR